MTTSKISKVGMRCLTALKDQGEVSYTDLIRFAKTSGAAIAKLEDIGLVECCFRCGNVISHWRLTRRGQGFMGSLKVSQDQAKVLSILGCCIGGVRRKELIELHKVNPQTIYDCKTGGWIKPECDEFGVYYILTAQGKRYMSGK